ncbi:hypothetical protein ACXYMU_10710 [Pontibacter sp. CAU 1760]
MKKITIASFAVIGLLSFTACNTNDDTTTLEDEQDNQVVVERDSVPTEYEVTETVVEYDTTTRTKTVDADNHE